MLAQGRDRAETGEPVGVMEREKWGGMGREKLGGGGGG